MKRAAVGILFTLFSLAGSEAKTQSKTMEIQRTTDQLQVLQLHQQLIVAVVGKQQSILENGLKPEFIFTSANAEVLNREAFINGFAMNPTIKLPLFEASGQQVAIVDKVAVVTARVKISIVMGNTSPRHLEERITETYVKEKGQWKLLASQATYLQPK